MSTLKNGNETLAGVGGTNANNLFDGDVQRLRLIDYDNVPVRFDGFGQDGSVAGTSVRVYDRIVEFVEIEAGTAPSGSGLIIQLIVNGSTLSQTYTLPSGQTHIIIAVTHDGNGGSTDPYDGDDDPVGKFGVVVVGGYSAGIVDMSTAHTLAVKVTTANGAADIVVTPHCLKGIL